MVLAKVGLMIAVVWGVCCGLTLHEMLAETELAVTSRMQPEDMVALEGRLGNSVALEERTRRKREAETTLTPNGSKRILDRLTHSVTINEHMTSFSGFELNEDTFAVAMVERTEDGKDMPRYLLQLYRIQGQKLSTLQWIGLMKDSSLQTVLMGNTALVVTSNSDGCLVYLVEEFALRQLQNLSMMGLRTVKLHVHQDEIILCVTFKTHLDVYEWEGSYFDKKTSLEMPLCNSMDLFTIDNTLYLAAFGEHFSGLWERNIQTDRFQCVQQMESIRIADAYYFRVGDSPLEMEHYLAMTRDSEGAMIYKRDVQGMFHLFQDTRAVSQWLPFQEEAGAFVLLGVGKTGVSAFTHDGFMFREDVDLALNGTLGSGCSSVQAFRSGNKSLIVAVNPALRTASIEQAIFKTVPASQMIEIEEWCEEMDRDKGTAVEDLVSLTGALPRADHPVIFNGQVTFRRANVSALNAREFGIFTQELVDHINELSEKVDKLGALVADLETLSLAYTSRPIPLPGPIYKPRLNILCYDTPCSLTNVNAELMNGDYLEQFLMNTVSLRDAAAPQNLQFEHLVAKEVTAPYVNSRPASTLVYRDSNIRLQNITVSGSVSFEDRVFVRGTVAGVLLDREHAFLIDGDQTLDGRLVMPEGVVSHLSLSGKLNHVDVSRLTQALSPALEEWRQADLTVTNLTIQGSLRGMPYTRLINGTMDELEVDDIQVSSEEISGIKLSDIVRTDEGDFHLKGNVSFDEWLSVDSLTVSDAINEIPLDLLMGRSSLTGKSAEEPIELQNFDGDRVIVKEMKNLRDIVNPKGGSFVDWGVKPDPNNAVDNDGAAADEFTCVNADGRSNVAVVIRRYDGNGKMFYEIDGPLTASVVVASEVHLTGLIDHTNWTVLMTDSVRQHETTTVFGAKKAVGSVNLSRLHVTDFLNDGPIEEAVEKYPERVQDTLFAQDLALESVLNVSEIIVNGLSILPEGQEEKVFALNGSLILPNTAQVQKINRIDVEKFFTAAVFVNQDVQLKTVNFVNPLQIDRLNVSGHLNGANFTDLFLVNSTEPQIVTGQWLFRDSADFNVNMTIDGEVSGMNLENLCRMARESPKVIISGSVITAEEPKNVISINNIELDGILREVWFRNEKTTIDGGAIFGDVRVWEDANVRGQVNGMDLLRISKEYLSKTLSRHMYADLRVANLSILGLSRARKMSGEVNGIRIGEFAPSVLQQGIEQTFSARANFENIFFDSISGNFTVNGLNLASDVLRYDVEGAVVSGEKTVESVVAQEIIVESGVMIQKVAFADWLKEAVMKNSGVVKGNVTFGAVDVEGTLRVKNTVGNLMLDSEHILTTSGSQKITGKKTILGDMTSSRLTVDGRTNGVELRRLVKDAAYRDGDVILSTPLELDSLQTTNLLAEQVAGVNVSQICHIANNDLVVKDLNDDYENLAYSAKRIHDNIADSAYFLDFYRVVQKFKHNVTAIALVPTIQPGPAIAVFRKSDGISNATVMGWEARENSFKVMGSLPGLEGNATFVATGPSLLVAQNSTTTHLLQKQRSFWTESVRNSSCVAAYADLTYAACFFIGQQGFPDVSMCAKGNATLMLVTQTHLTTDCIQATTVRAGNKTWLMVIGGKTRWSRSDVFLTVLSRRDGVAAIFVPRQDLAVLHPISVTAAVHGRYAYLVVASQHKPESVRSSLVTVFRYTSASDKWTRYQEIYVDAPLYVHLSELPTGQLALYVLTENPAKSLQVFLYRGVEGFVAETAGLGVRTGKMLTAFTVAGRHYVAIAGSDHGQLLEAQMRGSRHG